MLKKGGNENSRRNLPTQIEITQDNQNLPQNAKRSRGSLEITREIKSRNGYHGQEETRSRFHKKKWRIKKRRRRRESVAHQAIGQSSHRKLQPTATHQPDLMFRTVAATARSPAENRVRRKTVEKKEKKKKEMRKEMRKERRKRKRKKKKKQRK